MSEIAISLEVKITLSSETIKDGDVFYFTQQDGTPTIRVAKSDEGWSGFSNSTTSSICYHKVERIEGLLISPAAKFGEISRICRSSSSSDVAEY